MNTTPPEQTARVPLRRGRTKRAAQPELLDACPAYLTRKQTAHIAGVTLRTVDRWLRAQTLTTYSRSASSRPVLVSREQLRELLKIRAAEQQAASAPDGNG